MEHGASGTKQMLQRFSDNSDKNRIPLSVFLYFPKNFQWKRPFHLISRPATGIIGNETAFSTGNFPEKKEYL